MKKHKTVDEFVALIESRAEGDLWLAKTVTEFPYLRGRISVEQLRALLVVCEHRNGILITRAKAKAIFPLIRALDTDPSYVEVDDALYAAGFLPPLPLPVKTRGAEPSGPIASALLGMIVSARKTAALKYLDLTWRRRRSEISKRVYERDRAALDLPPDAQLVTWANAFVARLEARDLPALIRMLDSEITYAGAIRRFLRRHFGLRPGTGRRRLENELSEFCKTAANCGSHSLNITRE